MRIELIGWLLVLGVWLATVVRLLVMEGYLMVYLLLGWLASCALCVGLVWGAHWILTTYIKKL